MFETGFPPYWSTIKKFMWLKATALAGSLVTLTGSIVSFIASKAKAINALMVTLEPQQDLHGQDAPYPAGGGVNIIPDGTDTSNGYINNYYLKADGSTTFSEAYCVSEYFSVTPSADYVCAKYSTYETISVSICFYDSTHTYISGEAYNSRASFVITAPSNATYARITIDSPSSTSRKNFLVAKGSTAPTKWSPFANICPITGWTGASVTRTGKNLFNKDLPLTANKLINAQGEIVDNNSYQCSEYYTKVKPSTNYIFSGSVVSNQGYNSVAFYDSEKTFISRFVQPSSGEGAAFTTPSNCQYIRFNVGKNLGFVASTVQLEEGAIATDYESYQGTTYEFSWEDDAGTVYGGTLDVTTGVLTVDKVIITLTGTSADGTWSRISSGRFNLDGVGIDYYKENLGSSGISSQYKSIPQQTSNGLFDTAAASYSAAFCLSASSSATTKTIRIKDTRFDSLDDFKTAIASESPKFIVKLAEPITFTLTPQQISTLVGQNNIFSDSGDVTVQVPSNIIVEGT